MKKPLFLYSVHLPLLIALFVSLLIGFGAFARNVSRNPSQIVLADDDERDEDEEDSDDSDDDKNENEESDDSTNEDENSDDGDDKEDNDISEDDKNENGSDDSDDDQNENEKSDDSANEDEDSDDVDLDDNPVLINTVTNLDGTVTKTYQINDDGEVKTKTVTYGTDGKVISDDENEDETESEEEDMDEDDRDGDGHEIEFEYKNSGTASPELNGLIEAELEQEIETNSRLGTTINKVELEVKTINGEYKYEGTTFKEGKFLGLFDVSIPVDFVIDPETGKIISVNQSFWSKLLAFFSTK